MWAGRDRRGWRGGRREAEAYRDRLASKGQTDRQAGRWSVVGGGSRAARGGIGVGNVVGVSLGAGMESCMGVGCG